MYRVYLRDFNQHVLPESKTATKSQAVAADAFADLVGRADLDGQKLAAVVSYNNGQVAYHRFDREPGKADYWRNRLDEIQWPEHGGLREGAGAPTKMGEPLTETIRVRVSEAQKAKFTELGGAGWLQKFLNEN